MKKLLLLVVLLLQFTMYSQDTIPAKNTITTADELIDKYSTKAYEAVKELATALQVPAEYVFTILVKQAVVESITWLIVFIVTILFIILGSYLLHSAATDDDSGELSEIKFGAGMIILIVSAISFVSVIVHIDIMVGGFINPEYYAIKEVLSLIK